EAEETAVSPSSSTSKSKPLWKEDDGLDEDSQLELQMDWMSERLKSLISDGQRALGREIVLPENERPDVGLVDDGDAGWVDY
ncbi:6353_t:CDS:2, partial [Acaulospora colombiana]